MSDKRRDAANVLVGTLGQAGLTELNMTELSGAFTVDFMVPPTQDWERRNMRSSIHITGDGKVAGVQIRPPGAHESMRTVVRRASRATVNATDDPSSWGFHLDQKDGFGDKIEDVRPHISRDGVHVDHVDPSAAARSIVNAVEAYRRVVRSY